MKNKKYDRYAKQTFNVEKQINIIKHELMDKNKTNYLSPTRYISDELADYLKIGYMSLFFSNKSISNKVSDHFNNISKMLINDINKIDFTYSSMNKIIKFKKTDEKLLSKYTELKEVYTRSLEKEKEPTHWARFWNSYGMPIILIITAIVPLIQYIPSLIQYLSHL